MSIQAVSWVLSRSRSESLDRLVLLVMANHANEADEAWPSGRTIASEARISRTTVIGSLRRLCDELGELQRVADGSRTASARYRFTVPICRVVLVDNPAQGGSDLNHLLGIGGSKVVQPGRATGGAMVVQPGRARTRTNTEQNNARATPDRVDNPAPTFEERDATMRAQLERTRATSEAIADLPPLDLDDELGNVRGIRDAYRKRLRA